MNVLPVLNLPILVHTQHCTAHVAWSIKGRKHLSQGKYVRLIKLQAKPLKLHRLDPSATDSMFSLSWNIIECQKSQLSKITCQVPDIMEMSLLFARPKNSLHIMLPLVGFVLMWKILHVLYCGIFWNYCDVFFSVKVTLIFIGLSFLPNSMLFCVTVGT